MCIRCSLCKALLVRLEGRDDADSNTDSFQGIPEKKVCLHNVPELSMNSRDSYEDGNILTDLC